MADTAMISFSPESPALKRVSLKVGKGGDSVAALAKRYAVSAQQVAQWNKVAVNGKLAPGSTVVVYVPNTKGASIRVAAAPSKSSKRSAKKSNKAVRVAASNGHTRKR
jgi:membrane-bound lytic murein transglycosylase D